MTAAHNPPGGQGLLILPRLRIQNANAISSPLTHGFPSITAFMGLMWALQRKLKTQCPLLTLQKVGVVCHGFGEQVQDGGYVRTFCLTRNPVDKDGSTAAIVEEGRIHLDITLIFQVSGGSPHDENNPLFAPDDERRELAWKIRDIVSTMRVAGGSVVEQRLASKSAAKPRLLALSDDAEERAKQFRQLRRQWLPGSALVSRDDRLHARLGELRARDASASLLDAWLDLSRFNWKSHEVMETNRKTGKETLKIEWRNDHDENRKGWIVPIPVGYGALSDLHEGGSVANARDMQTPFRFVEGLYSIGEWVSPHHMEDVRDLLWYADAQPQQGLYRCRNDFTPPAEEDETPADDAEPRPELLTLD